MPSLRHCSLPTLAFTLVVAACSADAEGVFGESSSAGPGGLAGSGGQSGDGGAATTGTTSGDGGGSTSTGTSTGTSGPTTGSSSSTGDGGGATTTTSTGTGDVATSTAAGPTCGDGQRNGDEACDGADLDGASCSSLGMPSGGTLACTDQCTFDTTACNRCGNGAVNEGEDCDDGGNAPGDGCNAQCGFEGLSCNGPIDRTIDEGQTLVISTTNAMGPAAPGSCLDASGPGRIIRVMPQKDGFLTAWVKRSGTNFDSSLRMGYACGGNNVFVCADSYDPESNQQPGGGEVGSMYVSEGQPAWIFVEAWGPGVVGNFSVEIALATGDCEGPVVLPIERGSNEGIVAWGFNEGQGNDEVGTCGGNGDDVTYRLRNEGQATPVDLSLSPVQGYAYNPVMHVREGQCDEQNAQVACAATAGYGQTESLSGVNIGPATFVHADAAQNSNGGWRLRVTPPRP